MTDKSFARGSPEETVARVAAIAVQGMMNRAPQRTLNIGEVIRRLHLSVWWLSAVDFTYDLALPTMHRSTNFRKDFLYTRETEDDGRLGPYRWSTIEHVEGRTIHQVHSQKRVEQIAALAYTAPFAVEVVSDVAIALANERVRHAIRNGT